MEHSPFLGYSFPFVLLYDHSLDAIMAARAPLIVPALTKHTATVIWAHGLGDQGSGWAPVAENFRLRGKFEEVAFIFPNAPVSMLEHANSAS